MWKKLSEISGMKKKFALPLIVGILICTSSSTAFAYVTLNNHTLNGGVGNYGYNNRYYYITSSASKFTGDIQTAMNKWICTTSRLGITTPISYVQTGTQSASVMDIYTQYLPNEPYDDVNGWAESWIYSSHIDPWGQNWGWNKIYLNSYQVSYNSERTRGVISHEMGHCFGLGDNNSNPYSVMCDEAHNRQVTACVADDANGINYLY